MFEWLIILDRKLVKVCEKWQLKLKILLEEMQGKYFHDNFPLFSNWSYKHLWYKNNSTYGWILQYQKQFMSCKRRKKEIQLQSGWKKSPRNSLKQFLSFLWCTLHHQSREFFKFQTKHFFSLLVRGFSVQKDVLRWSCCRNVAKETTTATATAATTTVSS